MQKRGQSGAKRSIYRLMFTPGQFDSFCEKARFGVLFSMKSTRRVNEILLRSVKALRQWVDFTQNTAKAKDTAFLTKAVFKSRQGRGESLPRLSLRGLFKQIEDFQPVAIEKAAPMRYNTGILPRLPSGDGYARLTPYIRRKCRRDTPSENLRTSKWPVWDKPVSENPEPIGL